MTCERRRRRSSPRVRAGRWSEVSRDDRKELGGPPWRRLSGLTRVDRKGPRPLPLQAGAAAPRRAWVSSRRSCAETARQIDPTAFASASPWTPTSRSSARTAPSSSAAFANLLKNAAQVLRQRRVSVRARAVAAELKIRIVDRGPGIPQNELTRIFEAFYRGPSEGDEHRDPASVSPSSRASSRPTTVGRVGRVAARAGHQLRDRVPGRARAARGGGGDRGADAVTERPRVLVCDDESHIVRALKLVMKDAGFEPLPAETAAQALQVATLQRPDAAILDLLLPDGDGVQVCRAIREWSEMPIIVLSAVGDEDHKVRALGGGRRRLRDQAVQPPRASSPGCRRRCAGRRQRRASRRARRTDWRSTSPGAWCAVTARSST